MASTIYLDQDDVLGSIRARVEQAGDDRLTLVVPFGMEALRNTVNLQLLRRYLEREGVSATVVSRDPEVERLARAAGLRVKRRPGEPGSGPASDASRSTKAYQAYQDEQAHRRKRSRTAVSAGFAGLALAIAVPVSAAAMLLPSATVTLYPETRVLERMLQVRASVTVDGPDSANLAVPGEVLQAEFASEASVDLTQAVQPATRAQGSVAISNTSTAPLEIRPGARVGTLNGTVYAVQGPLSLPAGGSGVVPIVAEVAGSGGNTGAGTVDRLFDAVNGPRTLVTNPLAITGGRDRTAPRITETHYRQLREQAITSARDAGLLELQARKGPAQSFYPESVLLKVGSEELQPPIGREATNVTLRLNGTATAVAFRGEQVNQAVLGFSANLADGGQLLEHTLETRPLEPVSWDSNEVVFVMRVKALIGPVVDEEELKQFIKGRPAREAEGLLTEQMDLVGRPQIETEPFWSTDVPVLPWRITVRQIPR